MVAEGAAAAAADAEVEVAQGAVVAIHAPHDVSAAIASRTQPITFTFSICYKNNIFITIF